MRNHAVDPVALERIGHVLEEKGELIGLSLQACAHCSFCAESCFMYRSSGRDPRWSPAYKALNSIGPIAREKGMLPESQWESIRELVFDRCVLCMRCQCPVGISIPSLIAAARRACREKGVQRWYTTRRNA